MKISNSEKQLAKIISENGGWREVALWAAQDKYDLRIEFGTVRPTRSKGGDGWHFTASRVDGFEAPSLVPNWHQTILSRDEYFHLYPAPDADGWIEWKGGECPVGSNAMVDTKHRCGRTDINRLAAGAWWNHRGGGDIVFYRLHKPEVEVESTKPDCAVIEPKPTIEQLAADYRAKLAIAQQAQEEADSHRCGVEAALEKLVAAGKALGLVLGVAAPEPEPELVITDWRDLQIGDIIECIGSWENEDTDGRQFAVTKLDHPHSKSLIPIRISVPGVSCPGTWGKDFKFIRRPAKGATNA